MCSVCVWLPVRATLWHAANRTYVVFLWVGSVPIYTEQHSTVQPFSSSATDAFKFNRSGQSKRHRQNTGQIYIYRKQFNVCTCCWIIFEKKKLHTQKLHRIFTYTCMYEKCASVWEHEWQAKNTRQLAKEDTHRNSRAFLLTIEIFMWNNFFYAIDSVHKFRTHIQKVLINEYAAKRVKMFGWEGFNQISELFGWYFEFDLKLVVYNMVLVVIIIISIWIRGRKVFERYKSKWEKGERAKH